MELTRRCRKSKKRQIKCLNCLDPKLFKSLPTDTDMSAKYFCKVQKIWFSVNNLKRFVQQISNSAFTKSSVRLLM